MPARSSPFPAPRRLERLVIDARPRHRHMPVAQVVVAEPDPAAAAKLAARLHRLGHGVHLVCRRTEIAAAIREAAIDLVIADVQLLDDTDFEWVERFLARPGAPALVLICERPSLKQAMRAANLPLLGFLPSPLPPAQVECLVQRTLARRRAD